LLWIISLSDEIDIPSHARTVVAHCFHRVAQQEYDQREDTKEKRDHAGERMETDLFISRIFVHWYAESMINVLILLVCRGRNWFVIKNYYLDKKLNEWIHIFLKIY